MGGGTFWGLGSLITEAKVCLLLCLKCCDGVNVQGFDELLQLAASGNHKNVDMLVSY